MNNQAWIIFSILRAFDLAVVTIIDKYIITKWIDKPILPVVLYGIIGVVPGICVFRIHGFHSLTLPHMILAFGAGICFILMAWLYFHAAKIEEISRVVPLFYLAPFFVAILASLSLQEVLPANKYFGITLLVLGSILISYKKTSKLRSLKPLWLMILSSLFFSVYSVILKYLIGQSDFWTVFAFMRISVFVAIIPLCTKYLPHLCKSVRKHGKKVLGFMILAESLSLAAALFMIVAISSGSVTLVNSLSSIQPFFVFIFALILSIHYPHIIKEDTGLSVLSLKLLAIALMFIGSLFITQP